jgi:ElaB/YqjD/DUF883 family membrane-anchored ribosome-binding protein
MSTTDKATKSANNSGAGGSDTGETSGNQNGVRQSAADAYESARERTAAAYQAARERAGGAIETVRDTARDAGRRTAEGVEANPMAAVIGGLALGVIAGAFAPRTRQEEKVLGPVGRKVTDTVRQATQAAKDVAREQIDDLGLSKDGVQRKLGDFAERAAGAVRSSAGAAGDAVASNAGGNS